MAPTIHFMHGFIGYGKSSFAKKLADKLKSKRISMDDVYAELNDGRAPIGLDKQARAEILEITWQRIISEIKDGRDVIFDSGSWTRNNRDNNRTRAESIGARHRHYSIDCTPEIAWARVIKRNLLIPGNEYPYDYYMERFKFFEPMSEDEEFELIPCDIL